MEKSLNPVEDWREKLARSLNNKHSNLIGDWRRKSSNCLIIDEKR